MHMYLVRVGAIQVCCNDNRKALTMSLAYRKNFRLDNSK